MVWLLYVLFIIISAHHMFSSSNVLVNKCSVHHMFFSSYVLFIICSPHHMVCSSYVLFIISSYVLLIICPVYYNVLVIICFYLVLFANRSSVDLMKPQMTVKAIRLNPFSIRFVHMMNMVVW